MQDFKIPSVFAIILNYNGKDKLNACISSLLLSDYRNLEIVVVDNGSTDSSFDDARYEFSKVHFIKSPKNLGFSKGNNLGIRWALEKFADFIFVLNNDTLVEKATISTLVGAMRNMPSVGILSPLIFKGNRRDIWFAGGKIDWIRMRTEHVLSEKRSVPYPTEYVSGCAMFIRKDVFGKIGLFDERFFLYYEDADLSIRASREGFGLYVDPSTRIFHLEQSNMENRSKTYWLVLSALIFFKTHAKFSKKAWLSAYLPLRKMKNLLDVNFKKDRLAKEVRRAYEDFEKLSV